MKKGLKIWSLAAVCMVLLGSCHGQEDDVELKVQLVPSGTSIVADGKEAVTFQVLHGVSDVTNEANIYLTSHPEMEWSGMEFSTSEAGEYTFQAIYRDVASNQVQITASEDMSNIASRFARHICVMDLTGAWCSFCPEGFRKLSFYQRKSEWKDIVHILALHDNTQGDDPMALSVTPTILTAFGAVGYPAFVTDLRDSGSLTENVADIVPSFECSLEEYPSRSDVKISTSVNGDKLSVEVTLFAEISGEWSVCTYLVEDGIVAEQKDGSVTHAEYTHNHVARALLSASWRGDRLGRLDAEQEATKEYVQTISEDWNPENMYIMALSIDANGYVNNVAVCPLVNGQAMSNAVDYKYLQKQ